MWGQKSAAFLRSVGQMPISLGQAGLRSLSGNAEKIAKRAPSALGQSLTAAANGRGAARAPEPHTANPVRFMPEHSDPPPRFLRFAVAFGALVFVALAASLVDWMQASYRTFSVGGLVLAPLCMIVLAAAAAWLWRELRAWQRLAIVEQVQWDLSTSCETAVDEARFRAAFAKLRSAAHEPQFARFLDGADVAATVSILRDGLDRVGLQGMDAAAAAAIRAATRDVFFLSLISTNAVAEVAVFSFRALGLIRRVASAYGYRPGKFGLLRLTRHIFADIALLPVGMLVALDAGREAGSAIRHVTNQAQAAASAAHPLAGVAVGAIGHAVGAVAEGVTPRVAEATLAAGRIAQFGLLAAAIVRPVAFSEAGYRDIRNGVYKQILGLRKDTITSSRKRERFALADESGAA
jgi:uncharacterized membrane protein YcjF (UPF0283 family)